MLTDTPIIPPLVRMRARGNKTKVVSVLLESGSNDVIVLCACPCHIIIMSEGHSLMDMGLSAEAAFTANLCVGERISNVIHHQSILVYSIAASHTFIYPVGCLTKTICHTHLEYI